MPQTLVDELTKLEKLLHSPVAVDNHTDKFRQMLYLEELQLEVV